MTRLPRSLLTEIGAMAVTWAEIEQFVILDVSALTADADGKPTGHLRVEFRRLRELWVKAVSERLGHRYFDTVCNGINQRLIDAAKTRGIAFHGMWKVVSRGEYLVQWHEQIEGLCWQSVSVTLGELRQMNKELDSLLDDLRAARS